MRNMVYRQPKQILGVFKTFACDFHCTSLPINDRIHFLQPIHSKNQVMLQLGQNSTLNQQVTGLVLIVHVIMGTEQVSDVVT